jgi:hypothetical protein
MKPKGKEKSGDRDNEKAPQSVPLEPGKSSKTINPDPMEGPARNPKRQNMV